MDKKNLAFAKGNFIALGIGFVIVVIGLLLMCGDSSTVEHYNADIFSVRRIKVAPVVTFIGFVSIIYAIICSLLRFALCKSDPPPKSKSYVKRFIVFSV